MSCAGRDDCAIDDAALERYFASLEREGRYRVDEVLKESPSETTQLVTLVEECASSPFEVNHSSDRDSSPVEEHAGLCPSLVGAPFRSAPGLDRKFVRKFIKRESGMGVAYERIFEAQRAGRHFQHLPDVRECYANDDDQVVVMQHVEGETLQELVERVGPSQALASDVFPKLCDAATELHEGFDPPIIHRDLTPSNIVMSGEPRRPVLIDFGIAREYRDGAFADTTRFGTRSFAPPEQYGFGQTTVRSDVFALGMVLYFCLTGLVPDTYVDAADFELGNVSPAMRDVIARATALDPANRFASARDLRIAFLAGCEPAADALQLNERPSSRGEARGRKGKMTVEWSTLAGRLWNILLAIVAVIFLVACVAAFGEPSDFSESNPAWVSVLAYLVLLPLCIVAAAWMLFDKRRLARRFPGLARFTWRHWILLFVIAFLVMFFGIGITSTVFS